MHSRTYYPGLDAVRFFAAFSVMLFHLGFWTWAGKGSTADMFGGVARFDWLGPYCWFGGVGVQIFFVISGFVISASAANSTALDFAWSRFLRLYPGAWICATITLLAVVWMGAEVGASEYLRSVTLWLWGPWIDGSYWTLPIEICFYGMVFMLLMLGRFEQIVYLALGITLTSFGYNLAALFGFEVSPTTPIVGFVQRNHLFFLLDYGCFFSLGIWLWLSIERRLTAYQLALTGIAASGCLIQMVNAFSGTIRDYPIIKQYSTGIVAPIVVWGGAVAAIWITARSARTVASGRRFMVLRTMGLMTYPLYLIHDSAGAGIMRALIVFGLDPVASLVVVIVVALSVSFAVCQFAEPIIRKALRALAAPILKPSAAK